MKSLEVTGPLIPLLLATLAAFGKHLLYPFRVRSKIRKLQSAIEELQAQKMDVDTKLITAEHQNCMATEEIKEWQRNVETIETKTEKITKSYDSLCRCILNISPNLWSNYKICRNAVKKHKEVESLCEKRRKIEVSIDKPPALATKMPTYSSESPYLELALQYIKGTEHNTIGIWGMGGVGKTHLLEQINNKLLGDGTFSVVVLVTCSKECSEETVQNAIINNLSLGKTGTSTFEQKRATINEFLKKRSFMLLLDDIWSCVDLSKVGLPELDNNVVACKRKIVVATRSQDVCQDLEVEKSIRVDVLKWDQAWSLFVEKVTKDTVMSHPRIQSYAVDVAKELGGLPLALITVGRALRKKKDPNQWEHALEQLRKAHLDDDKLSRLNESVFHTLRFSYDSLESDTLRDCFLHCCLWPEDHSIERDKLVELWMGLGIINKPEILSAYNTGYYYIGKLLDACLLEEVESHDGLGVTSRFRLHDLIRDMALWLANNKGVERYKWIVQAGSLQQFTAIEVPAGTEMLSLMYMKTEKVTLSLPSTCSSAKLSTLLLNNVHLSDSKPLHFELFSKLIILDLSHNNFEDFPIGICKSIHLQYLNLSHCSWLKSLPQSLEELIKLRYLLLRATNCTIPGARFIV